MLSGTVRQLAASQTDLHSCLERAAPLAGTTTVATCAHFAATATIAPRRFAPACRSRRRTALRQAIFSCEHFRRNRPGCACSIMDSLADAVTEDTPMTKLANCPSRLIAEGQGSSSSKTSSGAFTPSWSTSSTCRASASWKATCCAAKFAWSSSTCATPKTRCSTATSASG